MGDNRSKAEEVVKITCQICDHKFPIPKSPCADHPVCVAVQCPECGGYKNNLEDIQNGYNRSKAEEAAETKVELTDEQRIRIHLGKLNRVLREAKRDGVLIRVTLGLIKPYKLEGRLVKKWPTKNHRKG